MRLASALIIASCVAASAQGLILSTPGVKTVGLPQAVTLGDYQFYTKASYSAFMAPFNGTGLTFTDTTVVDPATFPNHSTISWSWPADMAACPIGFRGGICGFLNLEYGNYNDTFPQTPITPRQIKNITTLNCSANATFGGTSSGYDVIYDQFLTPDSGGDQVDASAEVSVFLHTPSYSQSLINGATQIGTTTISGITWQVAYSPGTLPDYYFTPSNYADVPNTAIDVKAMFAYLIAQGKLTGDEYFNGLALGVEPRQGAGTAIFNSLSVVIQ